MMAFIRERGFVGILLLASWPNAAFDLCGMCCGKEPSVELTGVTKCGSVGGGGKVHGEMVSGGDLRECLIQPFMSRTLPIQGPT